jgi:hypothetical protein
MATSERHEEKSGSGRKVKGQETVFFLLSFPAGVKLRIRADEEMEPRCIRELGYRGIFLCSVASGFRPLSPELTAPRAVSCNTFQFSAHARVLKVVKEWKIRAFCHK